MARSTLPAKRFSLPRRYAMRARSTFMASTSGGGGGGGAPDGGEGEGDPGPSNDPGKLRQESRLQRRHACVVELILHLDRRDRSRRRGRERRRLVGGGRRRGRRRRLDPDPARERRQL